MLLTGLGFSTNGTENEKGLSFKICQEFIVLNKGKITIESEINVGSTVTITLPGKASSNI